MIATQAPTLANSIAARTTLIMTAGQFTPCCIVYDGYMRGIAADEAHSLDAVVSEGSTGPPGTTFISGAKISSNDINGSAPSVGSFCELLSVALLLIV
jgi:hypothetical protein